MKKETNVLLIIIGLALVIFLLFDVLDPGLLGYTILFLGSLLISFGLINFTSFKGWLKIILTIVSMIIVLIIWFFIGGAIHGFI